MREPLVQGASSSGSVCYTRAAQRHPDAVESCRPDLNIARQQRRHDAWDSFAGASHAAAPGLAIGFSDDIAQPLSVALSAALGRREAATSQMLQSAPGELTSIGSLKHDIGECSPCIFWFKGACVKAARCEFCHLRHKGQKNKRIRPSKKTRMQLRAAQQLQDDEDLLDEDESGFPMQGGITL